MTIRQPARILLIEDEAIILLDMEYHLQLAGFSIVGAVCTCIDAMTWLRTSTPDIAVLDIALRDGRCGEVAGVLHARSVPFIVHSGSTLDPADDDEPFYDRAWITKPSNPADLIRAIDLALVAFSGPIPTTNEKNHLNTDCQQTVGKDLRSECLTFRPDTQHKYQGLSTELGISLCRTSFDRLA